MIVVENMQNGEIRRFFVVDANINLGCVQAGRLEQEFGPERLLKYYNHLEKRIYEYARRYPDSFSYLPRPAYRYLMKPEIFETSFISSMEQIPDSWLVDQFIAAPLASVSNKNIERKLAKDNSKKIERLAMGSAISTRLYSLGDLNVNSSIDNHWGLVLDGSGLEEITNEQNNAIRRTIRNNLPIAIRLHEPEDQRPLIDWLIATKEAGLPPPTLLFIPYSLERFADHALRLLEIPNSFLLTNHSSISSLSSLIKKLRKRDTENWSSKLIFASGYPETQRGESLSEIICFLLSKALDLKPKDLQLIFGGNILRVVPGRPPFLSYIETKSKIQSREEFGEIALSELSRIYRVISGKKIRDFCSVDMMISSGGEHIPTNRAFLSVKEPTRTSATGTFIAVEKNEHLKIFGWNDQLSAAFDARNLKAVNEYMDMEFGSGGQYLEEANDLREFTNRVLDSMRIDENDEIISSLHFTLNISPHSKTFSRLHPDDMEHLNAKDGEVILAFEPDTGRWWGTKIKSSYSASKRELAISRKQADILNLQQGMKVDLIRYSREIEKPQQVSLRYEYDSDSTNPLFPAYFHLHKGELVNQVKDYLISEGIKFHLSDGKREVKLELQGMFPAGDRRNLIDIKNAEVSFIPGYLMEEFNLIICLETSDRMASEKIKVKDPLALRARLRDSKYQFQEVQELRSRIESASSKADVAIAAILTLMNKVVENRTPGIFSFLTFDDRIRRFTVQKGHDLDTTIGFRTEFSTKEVRDSLFYTVVDSAQDMLGVAKPYIAYRAIAENLDDFGSERPTLAIVFASQWSEVGDEGEPFLKAIIKKHDYQIDLMLLNSEGDDIESDPRLNQTIYPINQFSLFDFDKYVYHAMQVLKRKDA